MGQWVKEWGPQDLDGKSKKLTAAEVSSDT